MAEDIETTKKDDVDVESQIQTAMLSRVPHFKQQADSLTFEGVRRLLEKDLGFEEYSLDSHKRFIKQCLEKCLEEVGDDDASKMSGEEEEKGESTQEVEGKKEEHQSKDEKDLTEDEEKMEDSPVLGLLKEQKRVKNETKKAEGNGKKVVPNEALIKKAIIKRSSYLKANADEVTVAGLRRLLEEDLKLDKFSLDPFKKFIRQQLDEVLMSSEVPEPAKSAKKIVKKKPDSKVTKKVSTEENSDTSDKVSEEEESQEDEVKPKKKSVPKGKASVGPKKRKGEEIKSPSKKRAKPDKEASEDNSDAEDGGKNSEDDQSHSSAENTTQKKQVSTPVVYSKRVEHLKSVIKACGMSVPPVIYKKVKQVPENKREGQLIKELEEILSREGLSSNPSEKEIKEVKRKKERAKELEGIDMSNIVSSTRRRATTSFAAPPPPKPKPKTPVKTSDKDTEGSDNDKDDEVNDNEEDEEDEEDEEEEDSSDDDGSQSEEFNDDEEDSD